MPPAKASSLTRTQDRPPARISSNLDKGLFSYASAASAAGVGLLALVQPADAKVIYTPVNITIPVNGGSVQLDMNNDGVADFSFYNAVYSGGARRHPANRSPLGFYAHALYVTPLQSANEVGAITSFNKGVCAAELPRGHEISANKNFQPGQLDLFAVAGDYTSPGTVACQWHGKGNSGGYLAVKFVSGSNTYFGWVRISLTTAVPTITGYAYENIPNGSIKTGVTGGPEEKSDASATPAFSAPQPASLGALAQGAPGLRLWRDRQ